MISSSSRSQRCTQRALLLPALRQARRHLERDPLRRSLLKSAGGIIRHGGEKMSVRGYQRTRAQREGTTEAQLTFVRAASAAGAAPPGAVAATAEATGATVAAVIVSRATAVVATGVALCVGIRGLCTANWMGRDGEKAERYGQLAGLQLHPGGMTGYAQHLHPRRSWRAARRRHWPRS